MKAVLLSMCIILSVCVCALGFGSSDFSGNWTGDIVRTVSISGIAGGKAELTTRKLLVMTVKQQGTVLDVESAWSDNSVTKVSYILDGNEHSSAAESGSPMIYQAKLDGDQLLIQTTQNIKTPFGDVQRQTKEEWVLSADGTNLTVTTLGFTVSGNQTRKESQAQIYSRQ
jgi:hypothetical protein